MPYNLGNELMVNLSLLTHFRLSRDFDKAAFSGHDILKIKSQKTILESDLKNMRKWYKCKVFKI